MIERLICAVLSHRYFVEREFSPQDRRLGCHRCRQLFAMNDNVRLVLPWDGSFETLYRTTGQWPGRVRK